MDAAVIIALVGIALLVGELLLSTGGVLAALGALGLIAGGVLALDSNSSAADYVGPALIALGVLSLVAFYFIARKVIEAHEVPPRRAPRSWSAPLPRHAARSTRKDQCGSRGHSGTPASPAMLARSTWGIESGSRRWRD